MLLALLIIGYEVLRRRAIRDFPDETIERASEREKQRLLETAPSGETRP